MSEDCVSCEVLVVADVLEFWRSSTGLPATWQW